MKPLFTLGLAEAARAIRRGDCTAEALVASCLERIDALEPEVRAQIHQTLAEFGHHTIRFDHVVTRRAGARRFVDLHMHMPAAWTLGRAAAVRRSVEQALMAAVPGLRASIQLLPMDVEAHFDDQKDPL